MDTIEITDEQVIEYNKLIATFMGYTYYPFNMEGIKEPGWKTTPETSQFTKHNDAYNNFQGGVFLKTPDEKLITINKPTDNKIRKYLCRNHNLLPYYRSYNAIMDVVIKIGDMLIPGKWFNSPYDLTVYYSIDRVCTIFTIGDNDMYITDSGNRYKIGDIGCWKNRTKTPLQRTWLAVVEFIKWYNEKLIENGNM